MSRCFTPHDPDKDASQAYLWYTIALASAFKSCPSLSNNRFLHSSLVLERVLPLGGWQENEVHELIFGRSLSTFLEVFEDRSLFENLTLYGRCLNTKQVQELLVHLETSSYLFSQMSLGVQDQVAEFTMHGNLRSDELLHNVYQDALDMLRTPIGLNKSCTYTGTPKTFLH